MKLAIVAVLIIIAVNFSAGSPNHRGGDDKARHDEYHRKHSSAPRHLTCSDVTCRKSENCIMVYSGRPCWGWFSCHSGYSYPECEPKKNRKGFKPKAKEEEDDDGDEKEEKKPRKARKGKNKKEKEEEEEKEEE